MLSVEKTNSNKPYLTNSKDYISLSHKNDLRILAQSPNPIGLDIESYLSLEIDWSVFKDRFFNSLDIKTAYSLTHNYNLTDDMTWLIIFSAKEAYLKLTDLKRDPLNFFVNLQCFSENQITFRICDLLTNATVNVFLNLKQLPNLDNITFLRNSTTDQMPDILSIATF